MLRFVDGPAGYDAVALNLAAAPDYLRIVRRIDGSWYALDQPEAEAQANEVVHAYFREGGVGEQVIVSSESDRRPPVRLLRGTYRYVVDQPDDATLRDNAAWNAWVASQ